MRKHQIKGKMSRASDAITQHVFNVRNLPTARVTVYLDRAEVQRLICVKCKAGKNEVVVQGITNNFESNSVRVDGRGSVTICDVQQQQRTLRNNDADHHLAKQFEAEVGNLQFKLSELQDKSVVLREKLSVLSGISEQVAAGQKDAIFSLSESSLDNLTNFLAYYDQNMSLTQSQQRANDAEINKVGEAIAELRRKINELYHGGTLEVSNDMSIVLDSACGEDVEIDLYYIVNDASWTANYDIRVWHSNAANPKRMEMYYYGVVVQNTGEDWIGAQIYLSTAQPSSGGVAPLLPPLSAFLLSKSKKRHSSSSHSSHRRSIPNPNDAFTFLSEAEASAYGSDSDGFVNSSGPASSIRRSSVVDEAAHVTAVSFNIARSSTIFSDAAEHKLTIAIVQLDPTFIHETVPCKSPLAYLSARAINTSAFTFLPGPTAIYVDGSFVVRNALGTVCPLDEFHCSLGVDPSVRIDYPPAIKYREQSGIVAKSTVLAHERRIDIKNTKAFDPVQITVREQVPRSADKDIKIQLVSPRLPKNDKEVKDPPVKLDDNHNLEWTVHIEPGKTATLDVKFKIEHPARRQVYYSF